VAQLVDQQVEDSLQMTCTEAIAVLRARPTRTVWDMSLAAFSLVRILKAGGIDQVLLELHMSPH